MVNLDRIADKIHNFSSSIDVYGVLDSPVWLEFLGGEISDLTNQTKAAIDFLTITGDRLDTNCVLEHADELWKCIFSEFRLKYIQTPYMIITSSQDLRLESESEVTTPTQLFFQTDNFRDLVVTVDAEKDFLEDLATQILALLIDLKERRPEITVYAPSCRTHTYIQVVDYLDFITNGDNSTTMRIALEKGLDIVGFSRPRIPLLKLGAESEFECTEFCNRAPFNGKAEGTEPRAYSFAEGFYLDTCALGTSCGSCEEGDIRSVSLTLREEGVDQEDRNTGDR
jgi:hypothetical protein